MKDGWDVALLYSVTESLADTIMKNQSLSSELFFKDCRDEILMRDVDVSFYGR